jgi:hypothetical protein
MVMVGNGWLGSLSIPALLSSAASLLVVGLLLHGYGPSSNLWAWYPFDATARYSPGFLLRRAAAVLLDINEWELRVGLLVVQNVQGNVVGQVFLSDALENGAGYCLQFATHAAMERQLRFVSEPASSLLAPIIAASQLTNARPHATTVCAIIATSHGTRRGATRARR